MLNYFQKKPKKIIKICADIENLPFTESSFDVIISSFSLQWIQDFENLFDNLKKLLKPRGILAFALPDNNSFKELKSSPFFINKMPAILDLSKILIQNNLNQKLIKNEEFYEKFPNLIEALRAFKKIGANYNFQGERSKLKNFKELRNFYLKNFQNNLKLKKLSWSISYFIYSKND
jgi:ubiquinone/menaquinone biosynthesis C-methylase UbiE